MRFKTLLKILIGALSGLALLTIAAGGILLARPQLVVNSGTLDWVGRRIRAKGVDLRWQAASVKVDSITLFQKKLTLRFSQLCLRLNGGAQSGCFDQFSITVIGGLSRLRPSFTEVGPITGSGGWLEVHPEPAPDSPASPSQLPTLPSFIAQARFRPIKLQFTRVVFQTGSDSVNGDLTVTSRDGQSGTEFGVSSHLSVGDKLNGQVAVALSNPKGLLNLEGWNARLSAQGRLEGGNVARVTLDLDPISNSRAPRYRYQLAAEYNPRKTARASAQARGEIDPQSLSAVLDLAAWHMFPRIPFAQTRNCRLTAQAKRRSQDGKELGGSLHVDCPIDIRAPIPSTAGLDFEMPTDTGIHLHADLDTQSFPPDPSERAAGHIDLELVPILTPLFRARGKISSDIEGIPKQFPSALKYQTKLALELSLPDVQRVVRMLRKSRWAIWSPFQSLVGDATVRLNGSVDTAQGVLPVSLTTHLHSPSQTLDIDAAGKLTLSRFALNSPKPKISIDGDVVLKDVALELPRLALAAPPPLLPDSRIIRPTSGLPPDKRDSPEVEQTPLSYSVRIHTLDNRPIRILTNLAETPIPIQLDIQEASGKSISGLIQVREFPVKFFNRKAMIERLNLNLQDPTNESRVDGAVKVDYVDYAITVHAKGTLAKPAINLTSDPPLPEDQLVAVLLYGRNLDELDVDQRSSVGNTEAAVADRALGLFSLYTLASTPIQSLGYDPNTGEVLVKVRLGDGTSLNLGSDPGGNSRDVGIRRRLSKHWAITTDLNPQDPTNGDRSVVSAFLEWSLRY